MSDASLVPGWSNRGTTAVEPDETESEVKVVETAKTEDKAVRPASTTRKKS